MSAIGIYLQPWAAPWRTGAFGEAPQEDRAYFFATRRKRCSSFRFASSALPFATASSIWTEIIALRNALHCSKRMSGSELDSTNSSQGRLVVGVRNVVVEAERPEVLTVSNAARRGFDVVGFRLFLADRPASRQDDEKPDEG